MSRYSLSLSPELLDVLKYRAKVHNRSINGEITFLVEAAIAAEYEVDISLIRELWMFQGGVQRIQPESTGTGESKPGQSVKD